MVVDVPYVIRMGPVDREFRSAEELFELVLEVLVELPDKFLPAAVRVLNVDEFAVDEIERDVDGFYFRSTNERSVLGLKFFEFIERNSSE